MPREGELRVAKILTPMQIVLNGGSKAGIQPKDKFLVYGLGDQITDPETGASLEVVEVLRGNGRVIHVQEKICILETADTKTELRRTSHPFSILGQQEQSYEILRPFKEVQIGDYARPVE